MALRDFVEKFRAATRDAPGSRSQAVARIAELEGERFTVEMAPPSTAAWLDYHQRSLKAQCDQYLTWLQANHYSEEGKAAISGITVDTAADVNLLFISQHKPAYAQSVPTIANAAGAHPLAVTYFLRKQIGAELPELVKKFYGDTGGLEPKERTAKLAQIDAEIAGLKDDIAAFDAAFLQASKEIQGVIPEPGPQSIGKMSQEAMT